MSVCVFLFKIHGCSNHAHKHCALSLSHRTPPKIAIIHIPIYISEYMHTPISIHLRLGQKRNSHKYNRHQPHDQPTHAKRRHRHQRLHPPPQCQILVHAHSPRSSPHQRSLQLTHRSERSKKERHRIRKILVIVFLILRGSGKLDQSIETTYPIVLPHGPSIDEEEGGKARDSEAGGQCAFGRSVYFGNVYSTGYRAIELFGVEVSGDRFVCGGEAGAVAAPRSVKFNQPNFTISQRRIEIFGIHCDQSLRCSRRGRRR
mmetsp:Transcript_941/g.1534  ORF Transcript_941/g.1534 Transcript_941/m.1534 type:complete len:259 (-) Transcript_941:143-919(-)